jgi:hypothetical protein
MPGSFVLHRGERAENRLPDLTHAVSQASRVA